MLIQTAFALAALMPVAQSAASQAAPRLEYQSPLSGYRRIEDPPRADWPAANHEVHRIGGWQAYARMSQPNTGSAPAGAAAASDPHRHAQTPGAAHQGMHQGMYSGMHSGMHSGKDEPMNKDKPKPRAQHQHMQPQMHQHGPGRAPASGGKHLHDPAKSKSDTEGKGLKR
jgi:hypothetical protein